MSNDDCPVCLGVGECRHLPVPSEWIGSDGSCWVITANGVLARAVSDGAPEGTR